VEVGVQATQRRQGDQEARQATSRQKAQQRTVSYEDVGKRPIITMITAFKQIKQATDGDPMKSETR
jgi:hypothetical protein